jgi:hypothetical protein
MSVKSSGEFKAEGYADPARIFSATIYNVVRGAGVGSCAAGMGLPQHAADIRGRPH